MGNIHTETYNALKLVGVPEEPAQRAAIAVAGEQSAIMEKLNKMEGDIDKRFTKMEGDIDKRFTKLEKDIRDDIHALDKKFLTIATIMATALPLIWYVLRNNG